MAMGRGWLLALSQRQSAACACCVAQLSANRLNAMLARAKGRLVFMALPCVSKIGCCTHGSAICAKRLALVKKLSAKGGAGVVFLMVGASRWGGHFRQIAAVLA